MTTTSPCAPFVLYSVTCVLITAHTYNSAGCHLTSFLWQKYSNIFLKILQQQSFSTNGRDGDGKDAGISRKRRRCYQSVSYSPARVCCQLTALTVQRRLLSWEKWKMTRCFQITQLEIRYWFGIFFIFFLHPASRPWGFSYCEKSCEKLSGAQHGLFSRLTIEKPGEGVQFQGFLYDGSMLHF